VWVSTEQFKHWSDFLHFPDTGEWNCNETVHQLIVDFTKAYDSVRRDVLYSILVEFWILVK
jgi:hypothetical protein